MRDGLQIAERGNKNTIRRKQEKSSETIWYSVADNLKEALEPLNTQRYRPTSENLSRQWVCLGLATPDQHIEIRRPLVSMINRIITVAPSATNPATTLHLVQTSRQVLLYECEDSWISNRTIASSPSIAPLSYRCVSPNFGLPHLSRTSNDQVSQSQQCFRICGDDFLARRSNWILVAGIRSSSWS